MSNLLTRIRNSKPAREFALPEDKAHAVNAKARATQEYDKGHITKATEERVDRAANRKLHGQKAHEEYEHMTKR